MQRAASTLRAVLPDGVHRLELPTPFAIGPVSCYAPARRSADARRPRAAARQDARRARRRACAALGLRVEDVELVVLTHQHHDHVGPRRRGRRAAPARASPATAAAGGLPRRLRARDGPRRRLLRAMMARHGIDADARGDARRHLAQLPPLRRGRRPSTLSVGDGEASSPAGATFTAFERPGHSPTDTIFLDASDGLLVGGDHLLEKVSSNPIAHVPIDDRDPVDVAARDRAPRARRVPRVDAGDGRARRRRRAARATACRSATTASWSPSARTCTRGARGGSCARSTAAGRRPT